MGINERETHVIPTIFLEESDPIILSFVTGLTVIMLSLSPDEGFLKRGHSLTITAC
jgi:hypothetical protein